RKNPTPNALPAGTYEQPIPTAHLLKNLTQDKHQTAVFSAVMPLMKKGATLGYYHLFKILEEGMQIREHLSVLMVAPKCP
ncbi:ketol-acid reductoisomerase, partial [Oceanobacter sp. 2_MG-2023]|nr:ketol-acid reductoisomerase [Oceanobacter sp. 2_MG-2023]